MSDPTTHPAPADPGVAAAIDQEPIRQQSPLESIASENVVAGSAQLDPGDTILGTDLAHGGHLTHGMQLNFSGKLFEVAVHGAAEDDHLIDMAEVERLALEHPPALIVAGWSGHPRHLDFAEFPRIADAVGAHLMVDMAHFAGRVAAGLRIGTPAPADRLPLHPDLPSSPAAEPVVEVSAAELSSSVLKGVS